jgi:hypothetical protein
MTPTSTPLEDALRKKRQQDAIADSLGAKTPGNPTASPEPDGIAAKPKTVLINGIPHLDLPDQKFPGPLSMAASAAAGTIGYIATAPFGNRAEERLAANRAELNNDTAEPNNPTKPAAATPLAATPGGVQAAANQGIADLQGRQADYMETNNLRQFEDKGNGITRQIGADGKTSFTNVDTKDVTDPTKQVQVNSYNGAADNEAMAKANAVRQQLIDRQPMGGAAVLADPNAEWNARMDRQSIISGMQDAMQRAGTRTERAAIGQALNTALAGQNQMAIETMRGQNQQSAEQGRNSVTMRGQDINAQSEANRLAGNPMDNQIKQNQAQGIAATTENVRQQTDLRNNLLTETDPVKRTAMQEAMLVAQGRDPNQGRYIRMGGGEQVLDPLTGQKAKLPDQVFDSRTGQTVQTGKRGLTDATFEAIGKKIGMPANALKARYEEFQSQGPATSLKDFNAVDVSLALADGTPPEKIAATIKRLGGNPADFGI